MADFQFSIRPRVWIGSDSLLRLPLLAGESGVEGRAILIADPLLHESGAIDRVTSLLEDRGIKVLLFDELHGRATTRAAEDALRLSRGSRAAFVIGLGGQKTLMTARVAACLAQERIDVDAFIDGASVRTQPIPLIEIPTSLRHGFMCDDITILSDARDRRVRLIRSPGMAPVAVLIDPNLSTGLSSKLAASCVIDGLMGAVESYISARSSFLSDHLLEKAIELLAKSLAIIIARPDDPSARAEAWKGSFLAGLGQGLAAPGMGTALSLAINARHGVPKSSLAAILLPYSMEMGAKSRLEKIARIASLIGEERHGEEGELTNAEAASKAIEWLRIRLGLLKIPSRLKDFDLSLDDLVETARDARELDFMNWLPRSVSVDDVFDFVKTAY
ncbi:MAG TPA: iron-containing alcohol dehydrogenase [Rectinemataceae bacterium]|nr:iron-containing alcohol dehydrogenase [Rectinemataceae bacterium]